jgi:hypothetical protein
MRGKISKLKYLLDCFAQKGELQKTFVAIFFNNLFWVLFLSALIRLYFYSVLLDSKDFTDTPSYTNYNGDLFRGLLDPYRTPVYPYLIKFIKYISGNNWVAHLIYFQSIVSFISLFYFYKIAKYLFNNILIVLSATLFIGIFPGIFSWDKCILPESLAVSSMIFFLYLFIEYINKPNVKKALSISFFVLILIMLKPGFIYLLCLLILFWFFNFFKSNKKIYSICGLISTIICLLLLISYSNINYNKNGVNSISSVSSINLLYTVIKYDIYQNNPDTAIAHHIDKTLNFVESDSDSKVFPCYSGINTIISEDEKFKIIDQKTWFLAGADLMSRFDFTRLNKFIQNSIIINYKIFIKQKFIDILVLAQYDATLVLAESKLSLKTTLFSIYKKLFSISYIFIYLILLFESLIIIKSTISRKSIYLTFSSILILIISHLFIMILGAPNCYDRLFLPVFPFVFLIVFRHVDIIYSLTLRRE